MKLQWIAIGIVLLVASFMTPLVQADPYAPSPTIITPNKCQFVMAEVEGVLVESGNSATVYAFIRNNSDRVFYLDRTDWSLNNSFATIRNETGSLSVGPGGTGLLKATIEAKTQTQGASATGTLQVQGHLNNGQYCDTQSIDVATFAVQVKSDSVEDVCNGFQLFVPEQIPIEMGKNATINVAYTNDLSTSAVLNVHNNAATVSPSTIAIGANQAGNVTITLSNFTQEQSWTYFDITQNGCDQRAFVTLTQTHTEEVEPPIVPPVIPAAPLIGLSVDTNIVPNTGDYRITIRMTNPSNSAIAGSIGIAVPQNWGVESAKNVIIPAHQTATVVFDVNPNGIVSQPETGKVIFTYANKTTTEKTIVFNPNVAGAGLAFAFLGDNWPWLGLLLLILLVLFLANSRSVQRTIKSSTTTYATATTPIEASPVAPNEEEVVMGEPDSWKNANHPNLPETHVTIDEAKEVKTLEHDLSFEEWLENNLEKRN